MVVQHNLVAMNANRMFGITSRSQRKATEKLSSGYRINRAADDAAGLAMSEKMRRQIRGLTQASENCQDGISLTQVADGALNEMHDIMQRMNELAVKAANGTNTDVDRSYIQQEMDQLKSEINRISKTTTFNEVKLFDLDPLVKIDTDDYGNIKFDESRKIGDRNYTYTKELDFSSIGPSDVSKLVDKKFTVSCSASCRQTFEFSFNMSGAGSNLTMKSSGDSGRPSAFIEIDLTGMHSGKDIANAIFDKAKEVDAYLANPANGATSPSGTMPAAGANAARIGHVNALTIEGSSLIFFSPSNADGNGKIKASDLDINERALEIQAGAEAGQHIPITLFKINANTLGIGDVDVSTEDGAGEAITAIKGGIMDLSKYRSYFGAVQNRMEHTVKNLDNIVENTTAAESRIRDTDMAKMMVEFSNNSILMQAGQSMLAQANQSNQGVLSLLG